MRWWFCTASSPRSSTSNPKAAVLRRHRPKNGETGISRFRRFCLVAEAAPSRAGPDTGRRAHRRCVTDPPLSRCPTAPLPRRPAAAPLRVPPKKLAHQLRHGRIAAFGAAFAEKQNHSALSGDFFTRYLQFNKKFQILQTGHARGRSPNPAVPTHYPAARSHFRHIRHTGTRHRESPGRYIP